MLGSSNVHATIPVKDIEVAKKFYEEILGLQKIEENPGGVFYQSGSSKILVYTSEFAGTNQGTAASWEMADIESAVSQLTAKGVTFEHYDTIPGVTRQGDIHSMGSMKAAWFKDPSGNILCVGTAM